MYIDLLTLIKSMDKNLFSFAVTTLKKLIRQDFELFDKKMLRLYPEFTPDVFRRLWKVDDSDT